MPEPDPSSSPPQRQGAGQVRRLFPWSEAQAKLVLALLVAVVAAAIIAAVAFRISLHID
ncbi:MAG TPA: hypothetical protein VHN20_11190 [Beijerinckiaceae bacterium]|nr:hypothetical protein [Beijerinckiaceae bacterium]